MKKPRKLFLPFVILWFCLFVAVLVYGGVRCLLLHRGADGFDVQLLLGVLWELVPALAVLLAGGAGLAAALAVCVDRPVKALLKRTKGLAERVAEGKQPEEIAAGGGLSTLESELCGQERSLALLLEEERTRAEKRGTEEAKNAIAGELAGSSASFGRLTYDVCARVRAADPVGADLAEAFRLDGGRILLAIGDVWERGIAASLFAVRIRMLMREGLACSEAPGEILARINAALCADNPETLAATLFIALFRPETGELEYADAGHLPPVIVGETAGFLRLRAGCPLGLYPDAEFRTEKFALRPGQGLFLYTDGVVNGRKEGAFFGYDSLFPVLRERYANAFGAENIAEGVLNAVDAFSPAEDDRAVVVLDYPFGITRILRPELEELHTIRELLRDWLPGDFRIKDICLACEEIFTNIVRHAGAETIRFSCEREEDVCTVRFVDDGEPFDPMQETGQDALGLSIIRRISGEMFYRTKQSLNVLTLRFPAGGGA